MSNLARIGAVRYLERLLSFVLRDSAGAVAEGLVSRFGSIDLVASATPEELCEVEGVNDKVALFLKVSGALTSRRLTEGFEFGRPHTDDEIEDFLVGVYYGSSVETVYMLLIDKEGRVTALEHMGEGTVGASDVYPRRLLEAAIRGDARAVILAHNHPHGHGIASKDDAAATKRLAALFFSAGIELRSHYVISGREIGRVTLGEEN